MLMYIRRDDRLRHQIDEVLPPIRFYAQREIRVRVDVPIRPAEDGGSEVARPPGSVAAAHDVGSVRRQLCRDVAVEVGVCG